MEKQAEAKLGQAEAKLGQAEAKLGQSERPGASRGQLKNFYPKYFKDILNLVCIFGFFVKLQKSIQTTQKRPFW